MSSLPESENSEVESGNNTLRQAGILGASIILVGVSSIALAALSAFVFGVVYPSGASSQRLDVFLAFVAVAANIALTSGLILVYLSQNKTLKREADVIEDQQELTRTQMKPIIGTPHDFIFHNPDGADTNRRILASLNHLLPEDFEIFTRIRLFGKTKSGGIGTMADTNNVSNSSFRFKLSNSGYGIAKNFRLWLKLDVKDEDSEYDGGWSHPALTRLDRLSLYKFAENTIPAGQEDIEFEAPVELKVFNPPDDGMRSSSTYDFSEAAKILYEDGVEDIIIRWMLTYEDIFEEKYEDEFLSKRTELDDGMNFCTCLARSSRRCLCT